MNMPMEQLKARMDDLGLTFMAAGLETFLNDQAQQKKNLVELFTDLLELESIPRKERSARSRLKLSGIPHHKTLEDFDIDWIKGGITSSQISELSTLSFISRKQNVILMGPSGLGKTHLMCALGQKACRKGESALGVMPTVGMSGVSMGALILAASIGVSLILGVFNNYEVVEFENGRLTLRKKE